LYTCRLNAKAALISINAISRAICRKQSHLIIGWSCSDVYSNWVYRCSHPSQMAVYRAIQHFFLHFSIDFAFSAFKLKKCQLFSKIVNSPRSIRKTPTKNVERPTSQFYDRRGSLLSQKKPRSSHSR
jgi:hypothetical protein